MVFVSREGIPHFRKPVVPLVYTDNTCARATHVPEERFGNFPSGRITAAWTLQTSA